MALSLLSTLKCKLSENDHILEDPICLPCGYCACRECYKSSRLCHQCKAEHIIKYNEIKANTLVQKQIEENVIPLIEEIKNKIENSKNTTKMCKLRI